MSLEIQEILLSAVSMDNKDMSLDNKAKAVKQEEKDLHKIIEDPNMPRDVKKEIIKIFPHLS